MGEKLSWEEIKSRYDQEWVELVDYDWPEEDPHPRAGIVRVHAKERSKFDDLADVDPPNDSAYIFVGRAPRTSTDVVITRGYNRVILNPDHA